MATEIVQAPTSADRRARIAGLRESIARRALASIGVTASSSILRIERTGAVLTVATKQDDAFCPYAVDSFRLPIARPADPEFGDDDSPRQFTLVDQHGGFGPGDVDGMMGDALSFAATLRGTAVAA